MKKIMIIAAHPDDAEIGMGMKICEYSERGDRVFLLLATKGECKRSCSGRLDEAEKSAKILGVSKLECMNFRCGWLTKKSDDLRLKIEKYLETEDPEIVYTHFPYDLHVDHEVLSRAVLTAARAVPNLVYFCSPYSREFRNNLFFLADKRLMAKKLRSVKCFSTEAGRDKIADLKRMEALSKYELFRYLHHSLISKLKSERKALTSKGAGKFYAEFFCVERAIFN